MDKLIRITSDLPPDLHTAVKLKSVTSKISITEIVRRLLETWVKGEVEVK